MTASAETLDPKAKEAAAAVIEGRKYEPWTVDSALEIAEAAIRALLAASPAQEQVATATPSEEIIAPAECDSSCDDPHCPYSHTPLTLREAYENCLSRLRAAEVATATLVQVKPLEWTRISTDGSTHYAESLLGVHQVWEIAGAGYFYRDGMRGGTLSGTSLEAAKAAAQADYERRINSALVTADDRTALLARIAELEKALNGAREALVLAISFLGRDQHVPERLERTLPQIIEKLAAEDQRVRAALAGAQS